jgi:hypothetical protein
MPDDRKRMHLQRGGAEQRTAYLVELAELAVLRRGPCRHCRRACRRGSGHNCSARPIGIAERIPKARAAYEHDAATPRCSGLPPTSSGRPRHSGWSSSSTEAKNASRSTHRMIRVSGIARLCQTNHPRSMQMLLAITRQSQTHCRGARMCARGSSTGSRARVSAIQWVGAHVPTCARPLPPGGHS